MKLLPDILIPVAVGAVLATSAIGPDSDSGVKGNGTMVIVGDSVTYPVPGYKARRVGNFEQADAENLSDSSTFSLDSLDFAEDTIPVLTARDTLVPPDSLKETDPFRYKWYAALLDSATHRLVSDSLKVSYDTLFARGDTLGASADSLLRVRIDSTYSADSLARKELEFLNWYNSLDPKARKAYDTEQRIKLKMAKSDSLRAVKEDKQAVKDSITENTPRILETFFFPEEMQYKRIVAWEVDQDFHNIKPYEPDTSYNYHFYDYPVFRKDVNVSWLGMAGSPVQYYNWFNRTSLEDVEFYKSSEAWSFNPSTLRQYNSKTPHTELAYFGTLLAGDQKESDNLHIFTTQNITPELNLSFLYDLYGGAGILENEKTSNKTLAVTADYVGKRYMLNAGIINNKINRNENGGITDRYFIRDTSGIDSREIPVNLTNASTTTKKTTFFLDQQYRLPFDFIKKAKANRDSTFEYNADTLDRNVTSLFVGHSSEYSKYYRKYHDNITSSTGREFYHNVFNFNPSESADSMAVTKLDNRVFVKLQPWAQDAVVSSLNVGIGDLLRTYFDSTSLAPNIFRENSVYAYAGVNGKIRRVFDWDAKGHLYTLGAKAGDFDIQANLSLNLHPFRRAKTSPMDFWAHFETSLNEPNHYQQVLFTNHFKWENDFTKISTTKIQGGFSIPRWGIDGNVGYALLAGNIYYDKFGMIQQNTKAMSVLSAYLHKDFVIGGLLHLDNRALFQISSDQEVLPLPKLALNLKYFLQFPVSKGAMTMQIGANGYYNTQWYAPAFNPVLGVFHNQTDELYENGPFLDIFINCQWNRVCLFIKYQNLLKGWPMEKKDYFSAHGYIVTQDEMPGLKLGIFWPFYTLPGSHSHNNSK